MLPAGYVIAILPFLCVIGGDVYGVCLCGLHRRGFRFTFRHNTARKQAPYGREYRVQRMLINQSGAFIINITLLFTRPGPARPAYKTYFREICKFIFMFYLLSLLVD